MKLVIKMAINKVSKKIVNIEKLQHRIYNATDETGRRAISFYETYLCGLESCPYEYYVLEKERIKNSDKLDFLYAKL